MKKYFLLFVISLCAGVVSAQLVKQENQAPKKQSDLDWYNCSFEQDGVYGAEVNRAYEFLKGKKLKKRPIVALIGTGIDVEHEDLKQAIWFNPKEKADGKDHDKNGLVDDVNGWNYLGGKDGQIVERIMREGDREFMRLKDKYADYIFDGKNCFKVIDGKTTRVPMPENLREFKYYRDTLMIVSAVANTYAGWQFSYIIRDYAHKIDQTLKKRFPGQELTHKEFVACYDPKAPRDSLAEIAFMFMDYGFSIRKVDSWDAVYKLFTSDEQIEVGKRNYEENYAQHVSDEREKIVGDNYLDIKDNRYGNNVLLTSDAATGTMKAGVVAAKRGNRLGGDGIMDQAEIMTLRVSAEKGEPYLKDVALAIRYAVDHGADVITLPTQNSLFPEDQRKWVSEALVYAESKGVLVIVPVWELSRDLAKDTFYPNRWMTGGKELTNLMVVASSDKAGNPAMKANYGAKELDLFAPGIGVYSTYTGDTYQIAEGSAMSSSAVAGTAALIKAYYPALTGSQIRNIILESVTSRKGAEVEKGILVGNDQVSELFLFEDLCLSAGILNAYQAVMAADRLTK